MSTENDDFVFKCDDSSELNDEYDFSPEVVEHFKNIMNKIDEIILKKYDCYKKGDFSLGLKGDEDENFTNDIYYDSTYEHKLNNNEYVSHIDVRICIGTINSDITLNIDEWDKLIISSGDQITVDDVCAMDINHLRNAQIEVHVGKTNLDTEDYFNTKILKGPVHELFPDYDMDE